VADGWISILSLTRTPATTKSL